MLMNGMESWKGLAMKAYFLTGILALSMGAAETAAWTAENAATGDQQEKEVYDRLRAHIEDWIRQALGDGYLFAPFEDLRDGERPGKGLVRPSLKGGRLEMLPAAEADMPPHPLLNARIGEFAAYSIKERITREPGKAPPFLLDEDDDPALPLEDMLKEFRELFGTDGTVSFRVEAEAVKSAGGNRFIKGLLKFEDGEKAKDFPDHRLWLCPGVASSYWMAEESWPVVNPMIVAEKEAGRETIIVGDRSFDCRRYEVRMLAFTMEWMARESVFTAWVSDGLPLGGLARMKAESRIWPIFLSRPPAEDELLITETDVNLIDFSVADR